MFEIISAKFAELDFSLRCHKNPPKELYKKSTLIRVKYF
jgi:hypothetical protein